MGSNGDGNPQSVAFPPVLRIPVFGWEKGKREKFSNKHGRPL